MALAVALAVTQMAAQSGLQRILDTATADFPGHAGIWVKHLTTGEEAGTRANETFNSASVIKIPVLVLAMQMVDRGELKLDERIEIRKEDFRGGSGILRHHDPGLRPTLRDILLQMVITSDNTATDIAIGKVGGVARVNAWLTEKKFAGLKLVQTTGDLFAKYAALTPTDDRNGKTNTDRAYWLGEITPARDRSNDRRHREEDDRVGRQLRRDAANDAGAAGGAAPSQPLPASSGRAQDRRLPSGARQRRRHHLRAIGTDRRGVPRQRHSGFIR